MEGFVAKFLLLKLCVLLVSTPSVMAGIYCGKWYCSGMNPYCCYLDDGDWGCCWNGVYVEWWFWMIWVVVVIIVGACSSVCWRRRRNNQRRLGAMAAARRLNVTTTITTNAISSGAVYPQGTVYSQAAGYPHEGGAAYPQWGVHPQGTYPQAGVPVNPPAYTSPPASYVSQQAKGANDAPPPPYAA